MNLKDFLSKDEFMHDREAMLMHKLVFDARLVFARLGSRLQVLTGEVDHNGFDIVFDDGDASKRFQVKTVYGGTSTWAIHKRFLRPTPNTADYYGYETSPEGIGLEGGVILQALSVRDDGELEVKYHYTDLDILRAFNLGIIKRKHPKSDKAVSRLFEDLKSGYDEISIPRGALLEAKGPSELMALAGFNTTEGSPWIFWLRQVSALHGGYVLRNGTKLPDSESRTKEMIRESLLKLTPDDI